MLSHPAYMLIDFAGLGLNIRSRNMRLCVRSTKNTAKKTTVITV